MSCDSTRSVPGSSSSEIIRRRSWSDTLSLARSNKASVVPDDNPIIHSPRKGRAHSISDEQFRGTDERSTTCRGGSPTAPADVQKVVGPVTSFQARSQVRRIAPWTRSRQVQFCQPKVDYMAHILESASAILTRSACLIYLAQIRGRISRW